MLFFFKVFLGFYSNSEVLFIIYLKLFYVPIPFNLIFSIILKNHKLKYCLQTIIQHFLKLNTRGH